MVNELLTPYAGIVSLAFSISSLAVVLYFIATYYIGFYNPSAYYRGTGIGAVPGVAMLPAAELKPLSPERIKRVACHESGHLIAIGLFDSIPNKLAALIKSHQAPVLGNVSYEFDDDYMCQKEAQENRMRVTVAGQVAEEMVYGDCLVGAQSDSEAWELQARNYLGSFSHDYIWFEKPSCEAEARLNSATLSQWKNTQKDEVERYLCLNKESLMKAASILEELRECDGDELIDVIRGLKRPDAICCDNG
jgi:hypothetical protein